MINVTVETFAASTWQRRETVAAEANGDSGSQRWQQQQRTDSTRGEYIIVAKNCGSRRESR